MTTAPTLVLHAATVPPGVLQRLNVLMRERCGPCRVIQGRDAGAAPNSWSGRTSYHLAGVWSLPPAEVHDHLIAAFGQLTP